MIGVGTFTNTGKIEENVLAALRSGRVSYGPMCKQLEKRLAHIHGNEFGVASNSGTDSLRIAINALKIHCGWNDGDEVIVPAVTFVATINAVIQNKLTPVLVDVDMNTWNIDTSKITPALTDRTRAIIPVSLFGNPANLKEINDLLPDGELYIIHDACESMFARHHDAGIGKYADITCLSLYVAHHVVAGVGGCAITFHEELADIMRSLVNHGRDTSYISMDDLDRNNIENRFRFNHIGYSSRMMELQAAIALAQLDSYDTMLYKRQRNARWLNEMLVDLPLSMLKTQEHDTPSWMMFPVRLHNQYIKFDVMNYMEREGVETRECLPLVSQPCYAGMWNPEDYPVAIMLDKSSFYLPCHQDLEHEDIIYISKTLHDYFAK